MEIVFTKEVPNQARAGEIRRVADGFARNYLIPRGLAEVATPEVLKRLHKIKAVGDEDGQRRRGTRSVRPYADRFRQCWPPREAPWAPPPLRPAVA